MEGALGEGETGLRWGLLCLHQGPQSQGTETEGTICRDMWTQTPQEQVDKQGRDVHRCVYLHIWGFSLRPLGAPNRPSWRTSKPSVFSLTLTLL